VSAKTRVIKAKILCIKIGALIILAPSRIVITKDVKVKIPKSFIIL
jgi:hypothetical protein